MPEINALIAASREVTLAFNALYWGSFLSAERRADASTRLEQALNDLVRVAHDDPPQSLSNQPEIPS